MMDKGSDLSVPLQVEQDTKKGCDELQEGNVEEAVKYFESAYHAACKTQDPSVRRACAFNLGAAHIANHNPIKGIAYLNKAIPPASLPPTHINADLYYNFGLAYELIDGLPESTKYFELALEEYQKANDMQMAAEVASRLGVMYLSMEEMLQSARVCSVAAAAYLALSDHINHALSLCKQARALVKANKVMDALRLADDCMLICHKNEQTEDLGRIYNELGLIYTQCADYHQAQKCFELALPLSRGPQGNKKQQAIILQNLGAAYNFLGDYQRALSFHETAAALHAKLKNRNAQGQCFLNLAFAFSRLADTESAGECYLHAYQASKDTDDAHGQWQALEGLGAVFFHEGNYPRAIKYYQQALSILNKSGEDNPPAKERLIAKLNDALEHNLPSNSAKQKMVSSPAISPIISKEQASQLRRKNMLEVKRMPFEFERVAVGLGEYDPGSDYDVSKNRRQQKPGRDELDLMLHQVSHQGRKPQCSEESHSTSGSNRQRTSGSDRSGKPPPVKRRQSSRRKTEDRGRRQAFLGSLLLPQGYDSEEENKKKDKHKKSKKHKDHYSTPPSVQSQSTRDDEEEELSMIHKDKSNEMLAAIPLKQGSADSDLDTHPSETEQIENDESEQESLDVERQAKLTAEDTDEEQQSDGNENMSPEILNNTDVNLNQYQNRLEKLEQEESATESDVSRSQAGEDSSPESTLGPPDYTGPHPPGTHAPLHQTYLKPEDVPTTSKQSSNNPVKTSIPDPEDPTYQRISSLIPTLNPAAQTSSPDTPQVPPPPLPISQMSVAEQEAFLKQYSQRHHERTRDQVGRPEEPDVPLPQRKKDKTTSKACVLM